MIRVPPLRTDLPRLFDPRPALRGGAAIGGRQQTGKRDLGVAVDADSPSQIGVG
jgi:hypothetical protein